jgi:hypothetical protein
MKKYFDKVLQIADEFEATTLEEMDSVKLMNRTDTKFILNIESFPNILKEASQSYKILEIDSQRGLEYETTYFDTDDFKLYHAHQNGKLNRFKIRRREYCISGKNFLEIKFKNNKSRTIKDRIRRDKTDPHFCEVTQDFMSNLFPYSAEELEVKMVNSFIRLMLVHKEDKERITLDMNIGFKNDNKKIKLPFLVIAEVKQEGYSTSSSFIQILRKYKIQPTGMSKYCIGTALLNPHLKHNRFKPKLLTLHKLNKNATGDYTELFATSR